MKWEFNPNTTLVTTQRVTLSKVESTASSVGAKAKALDALGLSTKDAEVLWTWGEAFSFVENAVSSTGLDLGDALNAKHFQVLPRGGAVLPVVDSMFAGELSKKIDYLVETQLRVLVGKLSVNPQWRQILPPFGEVVPTHTDPTVWISDATNRLQILQGVKNASLTLEEKWRNGVLEINGLTNQARQEVEFWNSVICSRTSLARWYRYLAGNADMGNDSNETGIDLTAASAERVEKFAQLSERISNAAEELCVLEKGTSYFTTISSLDFNEGTLASTQIDATASQHQLLLGLLTCDFNGAVDAVERIRKVSPDANAATTFYFSGVSSALVAEGDFTNLNMLLDCAGDSVPDSDSWQAESLRKFSDQGGRIYGDLLTANRKMFSLRPLKELKWLRQSGVDTPELKKQFKRHGLKRGMMALAALIALGGIGVGLDGVGMANFEFVFDKNDHFSEVDVILLPLHADTKVEGKVSGVEAETLPMEEEAVPIGTETGAADKSNLETSGVLEAGSLLAAALAEARREVTQELSDEQRQSKSKTSLKFQTLLNELDRSRQTAAASHKQLMERLKRERDDALDETAVKAESELNDDSKSRLAAAQGSGDTLRLNFDKMETTILAAIRELAPSVKEHAINTGAVARGSRWWQLEATIFVGDKSAAAFSGSSLFSEAPTEPLLNKWTKDYAESFYAWAKKEMVAFESGYVVFSVKGTDVKVPYERRIPFISFDPLKPIYETLKKEYGVLAKSMAQIGESELQITRRSDEELLRIQKLFTKNEAEAQAEYQAALRTFQDTEDDIAHKQQEEGLVGKSGNFEERVIAKAFEKLWNNENLDRTQLAYSPSISWRNGVKETGRYQIIARAKEGNHAEVYRTQFILPSMSRAPWLLFSPTKLKLIHEKVEGTSPNSQPVEEIK